MNNHTFGELFGNNAPRVARPSRSTARARPSYNENLLAASIGERDDGDAHPSTFPCYEFLQDNRHYFIWDSEEDYRLPRWFAGTLPGDKQWWWPRSPAGQDKKHTTPSYSLFRYYLATSILGRENTSNISHFHLAFLAAALTGVSKYHLGVIIARRLATRGPIYGGIIASRIVADLGLAISPDDVLLPIQRLDLAAMKLHHFVTPDSRKGKLVYRMLFTDGDEREIPMPQSFLSSFDRKSWS